MSAVIAVIMQSMVRVFHRYATAMHTDCILCGGSDGSMTLVWDCPRNRRKTEERGPAVG